MVFFFVLFRHTLFASSATPLSNTFCRLMPFSFLICLVSRNARRGARVSIFMRARLVMPFGTLRNKFLLFASQPLSPLIHACLAKARSRIFWVHCFSFPVFCLPFLGGLGAASPADVSNVCAFSPGMSRVSDGFKSLLC